MFEACLWTILRLTDFPAFGYVIFGYLLGFSGSVLQNLPARAKRAMKTLPVRIIPSQFILLLNRILRVAHFCRISYRFSHYKQSFKCTMVTNYVEDGRIAVLLDLFYGSVHLSKTALSVGVMMDWHFGLTRPTFFSVDFNQNYGSVFACLSNDVNQRDIENYLRALGFRRWSHTGAKSEYDGEIWFPTNLYPAQFLHFIERITNNRMESHSLCVFLFPSNFSIFTLLYYWDDSTKHHVGGGSQTIED